MEKFGRKVVLKNGMEQLDWQFIGKIGGPIRWTNLMGICLNNQEHKLGVKFGELGSQILWKMGGQFGWKY